jgi:hypothetical protein
MPFSVAFHFLLKQMNKMFLIRISGRVGIDVSFAWISAWSFSFKGEVTGRSLLKKRLNRKKAYSQEFRTKLIFES